MGPLPLVLAVTGHRDLRAEDEGPLKQRIQSIFAEFRQKYPHTAIRLLSGLAEGADRLAATVALESGEQLIACLPTEKSIYETDFETIESRQEFDELLKRAARIVTLHMAEGNDAETVKGSATGSAIRASRPVSSCTEPGTYRAVGWDRFATPGRNGVGGSRTTRNQDGRR